MVAIHSSALTLLLALLVAPAAACIVLRLLRPRDRPYSSIDVSLATWAASRGSCTRGGELLGGSHLRDAVEQRDAADKLIPV